MADLTLTDATVEAEGEVHSSGTYCGFSFVDRTKSDERWVVYAQDGSLRLWHSIKGDVVTLSSDGLLFIAGDGMLLATQLFGKAMGEGLAFPAGFKP